MVSIAQSVEHDRSFMEDVSESRFDFVSFMFVIESIIWAGEGLAGVIFVAAAVDPLVRHAGGILVLDAVWQLSK